jgi:hypothetical protein
MAKIRPTLASTAFVEADPHCNRCVSSLPHSSVHPVGVPSLQLPRLTPGQYWYAMGETLLRCVGPHHGVFQPKPEQRYPPACSEYIRMEELADVQVDKHTHTHKTYIHTHTHTHTHTYIYTSTYGRGLCGQILFPELRERL